MREEQINQGLHQKGDHKLRGRLLLTGLTASALILGVGFAPVVWQHTMNQQVTAADTQSTTTYQYGDLVKRGAVKTTGISWNHQDGDQLTTGNMDYLQSQQDGKTSISFTLKGNCLLKAGNVIKIPVSTNLSNQAYTQGFNISNLNTELYDNGTHEQLSKNVHYDADQQAIIVPLDGQNFSAKQDRNITLTFNTAGGMVFPKSAANGSDLSFSETVADQTHNYHWAPKATTANFKENNQVGKMQSFLTDSRPEGISIRTRINNVNGEAFTKAANLNDGQDYVQTIDIKASTQKGCGNVPVHIEAKDFSPYVVAATNIGPATETAGWTDQAANNWGATSNATTRIANWFTESQGTPAANQYQVVRVSASELKVIINFGKSQSLEIPKDQFETLMKSQYAHVSDEVIQQMETRYQSADGNVNLPYTIMANMAIENPDNVNDKVNYSASFSDNRGVVSQQNASSAKKNYNFADLAWD